MKSQDGQQILLAGLTIMISLDVNSRQIILNGEFICIYVSTNNTKIALKDKYFISQATVRFKIL